MIPPVETLQSELLILHLSAQKMRLNHTADNDTSRATGCVGAAAVPEVRGQGADRLGVLPMLSARCAAGPL